MITARFVLIALCLVLCSATAAPAQISIGIGLPNVNIGINIPLYPELAPVPGYPVYYAPRLSANYFFYDGMYWVYSDDNWYASSWYNGPWALVDPVFVPVFILRIPVRYYVRPPVYFHGWRRDAPPLWGRHWGTGWEQRRRGWDRWNRANVPTRAPLPVYQRQYKGDRYPRLEQQQSLHRQQYRHQPRNENVRRIYRQQMERRTPATDQRGRVQQPPVKSPQQRDIRRTEPPRQIAPAPDQRRSVQQPPVRSPQQRDIRRTEPPRQIAPVPDQRRSVQQPPVRSPQQRDIRRTEPPRQIAPAGPLPQSQPRGATVKEPRRQPRAIQTPRVQDRGQRLQDVGKQRGPGTGRVEGGKKGGDDGRDRGQGEKKDGDGGRDRGK